MFTALLAKRNLNLEAGTEGRWRTFFPTDEETDKVLQTTWLIATAVGALHIASLVLDLYLVVVFRKIARLPPDMNPLEDNLTSRRKNKHKYKDSTASATPLTQEEKRLSAQSSNTMVGNRNSQNDPLIADGGIPSPDRKAMSFMHTRGNSDMTYSPHTPNSAKHSRERFSMYSQPAPNRQSRSELNHRDDLHRRDDADSEQTLAQRKSFLAQQAIKRNSRPNSFVSSSSKQDFYTPPGTGHKHESSGDISLQSRESLQSDNWFVYGEPEEQEQEQKNQPVSKTSFFASNKQGYNSVATYDDVSDEEYGAPIMPQPLRMNPPTPPPGQVFQRPKNTPPPSKLQRTETATSLSSEATFNRTPTRGSVKTRYYGDLKAATQGIRGKSPANSPSASPTKNKSTASPLPSAAKQYTTNSPVSKIRDAPFSLDKKSFASVRKTGETGYMPVKAQSPRVVSRSGVDYGFDDSDLGTPGRRRDVSGKVAEEGRGGAERWGMKGHGLTYRNVSGVA